MSSLIDKHAPLHSKSIVLRPSCSWYSNNLHEEKHLKRKLERKWRQSKLTVDHQIYRNQCATVNKSLKHAREIHYTDKIQSCGRDQKSIYKVTNQLLGKKNEVILPSHSSSNELAQDFSEFFVNKIEGIRSNISSQTKSNSDTLVMENSKERFLEFTPASEKEVAEIISKSANKSCELDPIPTWLLKECIAEH